MNSAGMPTAYEHGNRLTAPGSTVDPILVEIVQGTLASVEMEVETAIARTSRSPMIRDAHDFRDDPRQQVEWVNLRVTGVGPITRPELREVPSRAASDEGPRVASRREVCFEADDGYVETDVYWRPDLRAGDMFSGPAVVEEFGSTVPVHPGFVVRVDAFGNLVVTKEAQ